MKPAHVHDCDTCVYLGTAPSRHGVGGKVDYYVCPQMGWPTIIARYGIEGDYTSGDYDYFASRSGERTMPAEWLQMALWLMRHWKKHHPATREKMKRRRADARIGRRQKKRWAKDPDGMMSEVLAAHWDNY